MTEYKKVGPVPTQVWTVDALIFSIDEGWSVTQGPSSKRFYVVHDVCEKGKHPVTTPRNNPDKRCSTCGKEVPESTFSLAVLMDI